MITRLAILLLCLAASRDLSAQQPSGASSSGWRAVFKHDPEGRRLGGDKQQLIDGIRRGLSVRLAWGVRHPRDSTRSVEHTALPVFLTIVDDAEVFVQVAEHLALADYWDPANQGIGDPRLTWSAVLGTTGTFNALWYNRASGELVRRLPQRVTITWYLEGGSPGQGALPLYAPVPPDLRPPA